MEVVPTGPASFDVPEEAKNIDMDLYSRQYYVYGGKAMTKMADSNVFLSGLGGLGVEIGTAPLPYKCKGVNHLLLIAIIIAFE